MDNLKTLFEKKEYKLIIKLTESSSDSDSLWYRISAFLATNNPSKALEVINSHKDALEKTKLPQLMKLHIELLCMLKMFEIAFEKLEYYKNLPYYSQEAEETLKELPKIIIEYQKSVYGSKITDDDQIYKLFLSNESNDVMNAINSITIDNYKNFYMPICKILKSFHSQSIRSLALLKLVERKIDDNFEFNHAGKIITVNPSTLKLPLGNDGFTKLANDVSLTYKDPSLAQTILYFLTNYITYFYPTEINVDNELIEACNCLACSYLHIDYDMDKNGSGLNKNKIDKYLSNLKLLLQE